jgi:chromosome segregation ATPase
MSSNVFEGASNPSEEASIDLEFYEWVPASHAAMREMVSIKTIYSRVDAGYYKSKKEGSKQLEVLLPKRSEATSKPSNEGEKAQTYVSPPVKQVLPEVSNISPLGEDFQTSVLTLLRQQAQLSERLLSQGDELQKVSKELAEKKAEIAIATNERANYNTSLQRAKTDREELEQARKEINALKAQLEAEKKKSALDKLFGR